jgi:hypothetical protein
MISATIASSTSNNNLSYSIIQLLNVPTKLNNVASHAERKPEIMPNGYIPSDLDVCCGRGKQNWNMTGNLYFRKLIRASVARYIAAPSRKEKTAVVVSVVDEVRRQGGHFLKQQHQRQHGSSKCCWYDMGGAAARDKVGHSLRDQMVNSVTKSSALRQAKEQTRRCVADTDTASDCDSMDFEAISTLSWWI